MIAHDEFIAGECIERVFEFRGLGNREIAGIGHAIELPLQQRLAGRLARNVNDCVSTKAKGADSSRLYMPTDGRRRVLLDAEHRTHAGAAGRTVFDGLGAEEQARGRQALD